MKFVKFFIVALLISPTIAFSSEESFTNAALESTSNEQLWLNASDDELSEAGQENLQKLLKTCDTKCLEQHVKLNKALEPFRVRRDQVMDLKKSLDFRTKEVLFQQHQACETWDCKLQLTAAYTQRMFHYTEATYELGKDYFKVVGNKPYTKGFTKSLVWLHKFKKMFFKKVQECKKTVSCEAGVHGALIDLWTNPNDRQLSNVDSDFGLVYVDLMDRGYTAYLASHYLNRLQ